MIASQKHPEYTTGRVYDWLLCEDAYQGETAMKARDTVYLPKPSGYSKAGGHADDGLAAYTAYKDRAEFMEIMGPSVGAMIGIIHDKEIGIEMPDALEYLYEDVDGKRKTLSDFHRLITRNLLVTGRYGVLVDAPSAGGDPYLAGYKGQTIINWDETVFFVLDESEYIRDGFTWKAVEQYRILEIVEGRYVQRFQSNGEDVDITPTMIGGGGLRRIPFTVASATDIGPDIETPPLIGIARAAKAAYQVSADERLKLFMSGQGIWVAINGPAPEAVGAGVVHEMYGSEGLTPDLKYVEPPEGMLQAQASKLEKLRQNAMQSGARMFEQGGQSQESGEARRLRFRSETANLQTVAQASCSLLERALRDVAMMKGLNEADVIVTPPSDLLDSTLKPQHAAQLWQIVKEGGMSYETFYDRLQKGGLASADRTADEEYNLTLQKEFEGEAFT